VPPLLIGVIGGEFADGGALDLAYQVGREIGARGHHLVCGGRGGVMREACRGVRDGGGLAVAVLPGDDLADANEYVDIPILTGIGFARNAIIARTANALIAIDGAYGTLSEIAFGFIAGRPIIGLGTWEMTDGQGVPAPVLRASTAVEAVDLALTHAREHPRERA
jgi:uncharacterized protein (TIGR00725 family)